VKSFYLKLKGSKTDNYMEQSLRIRNSAGRIIFITCLLAFAFTSFFQGKAKILIIGDSISIGHTPFVQENLSNTADVFHNPGNAQHTGTNLDSLARLLKRKSDAKLIFVTISFVPENEAGRFKEDAIAYNQEAIKIMTAHKVLVHDIYEKSKSIYERFGKGKDDVHYSKEGFKELGLLISGFLRNQIVYNYPSTSNTKSYCK
jgi:hypothetical protein